MTFLWDGGDLAGGTGREWSFGDSLGWYVIQNATALCVGCSEQKEGAQILNAILQRWKK